MITALAVVLVALVVAVSSAAAHYSDTHIAAAAPADQPAPAPSVRPDRIDFVTSEGSGQLILLNWSWSQTGELPASSGTYLRVEVELVCATGVVDYSPLNFQAFDDAGRQVDVAADGIAGPELETGVLQAGQTVRGAVAFDMPRGGATLLMSDGVAQTVTALKIPQ